MQIGAWGSRWVPDAKTGPRASTCARSKKAGRACGPSEWTNCERRTCDDRLLSGQKMGPWSRLAMRNGQRCYLLGGLAEEGDRRNEHAVVEEDLHQVDVLTDGETGDASPSGVVDQHGVTGAR